MWMALGKPLFTHHVRARLEGMVVLLLVRSLFPCDFLVRREVMFRVGASVVREVSFRHLCVSFKPMGLNYWAV
jgi:hypothetical protein